MSGSSSVRDALWAGVGVCGALGLIGVVIPVVFRGLYGISLILRGVPFSQVVFRVSDLLSSPFIVFPVLFSTALFIVTSLFLLCLQIHLVVTDSTR